MASGDKIIMSVKELRRVHVIHQVMEKKMRQVEAGVLLGVTDRQVRRLLKRVRAEGDDGLVHRGRGKSSNRVIDERVKARVLRVYGASYADFGPTLAAEKLSEREGIDLSDETLRLWLLAAGVTHFQRRKRPHRQWRVRKAHRGELVQMDGSHHAWLEDRGPACVLMGYIDDASGRVFARFYEYEGTIPAMDSFRRYIQRYGIPMTVYLDKHSTYKSPAAPTIEEQLEGRKPQSQFERAMSELGVAVMHANSPQAKGRIERLFKTFQDRLIKEIRLAGIDTIAAANRFLGRYLPIYSRRFSIPAANSADWHQPIPEGLEWERILCIKTERALRKDFTVAHNGRLYQVDDTVRTAGVTVEERVDGRMYLRHQGKTLRYHAIPARSPRVRPATKLPGKPHIVRPAADHPWRQRILVSQKTAEDIMVT